MKLTFHGMDDLSRLLRGNIADSSTLQSTLSSPFLMGLILSMNDFKLFISDLPKYIRENFNNGITSAYSYSKNFTVGFGQDCKKLTLAAVSYAMSFRLHHQKLSNCILKMLTINDQGDGNVCDVKDEFSKFLQFFEMKNDSIKPYTSIQNTFESVKEKSLFFSHWDDLLLDSKLDSENVVFINLNAKHLLNFHLIRYFVKNRKDIDPKDFLYILEVIKSQIYHIETFNELSLDDLTRILQQSLNFLIEIKPHFKTSVKHSDHKNKSQFQFSEIINHLMQLILESINKISGAPVLFQIILESEIHHFIMDDSIFSSYIRTILTSALLTYSKRLLMEHNEFNRIELKQNTHCVNLLNEITNLLFSKLEDQEINNKMFPIFYLLQFFTDDNRVKTAFSKFILSDRFGLNYLNLSTVDLKDKSEVSLHTLSPFLKSIFESIDINYLNSNLKELYMSRETSKVSNIMDGTIVNLEKCNELYCFKFYFELKSLFVSSNGNNLKDEYVPSLNLSSDYLSWRKVLGEYLKLSFTIKLDHLNSVIKKFEENLHISEIEPNLIGLLVNFTSLLKNLSSHLSHDYIIKILNLLIQNFNSGQLTKEILLFSIFPVGMTVIGEIFDSPSPKEELSRKYLEHLRSLSDYYFEYCLNMLENLRADTQNIELFKKITAVLDVIFEMFFQDLEQKFEINNDISYFKKQTYMKLNKIVKRSLQIGLNSQAALMSISYVIRIIQNKQQTKESNYTDLIACEFCNPVFLFKLLTGHSDFKVIIASSSNAQYLSQLLLLLNCIFHITKIDYLSEFSKDDVIEFVEDLLTVYSGTISDYDRLIFRILKFLNDKKFISDIYTLKSKKISQNSVDTSDWIFTAISSSMVYKTISNFPYSRRYDIPLFDFEFSMDKPINDNDDPENFFLDSLVDVNKEKDEEKIMIYDPAFWIPNLLTALNRENVPVRNIGNSGLLSIVLMSLSSDCKKLRIYALACLHKITIALSSKYAEKDILFRERPQVLLLIQFIQNSISPSTYSNLNNNYEVPVFNSMSAVFFARASMHLLQINHELYRLVNKYLLSKPFFDEKDVPLYDLVITSADIETESNELLSVLRILRDGLNRKTDHLNLCRKNTYIHLMLRFPQFLKDVKICHATLDIFDKALTIPSGARYLFERCSFITWISHLISPASIQADTHHKSLHKESKNTYSHTMKIFGRILNILRRCRIADNLLGTELNWKSQALEFYSYACSFLDEVLDMDILSMNSLRVFIHFIWDCGVISAQNGPRISFGISRLIKLSEMILIKQNNNSKDFLSLRLHIFFMIALGEKKELVASYDLLSKVMKTIESLILELILIPANEFIGQSNSYSLLVYSSKEQHKNLTSNLLNSHFCLNNHLKCSDTLEDKWKYLNLFDFENLSLSNFNTIEIIYITMSILQQLILSLDKHSLQHHSSIIRTILFLHNTYEKISAKSNLECPNESFIYFYSLFNSSERELYSIDLCSFQFNMRVFLTCFYLVDCIEEFHSFSLSIKGDIFQTIQLGIDTFLLNKYNDSFLHNTFNYEQAYWNDKDCKIIMSELSLSSIIMIRSIISLKDKFGLSNSSHQTCKSQILINELISLSKRIHELLKLISTKKRKHDPLAIKNIRTDEDTFLDLKKIFREENIIIDDDRKRFRTY